MKQRKMFESFKLGCLFLLMGACVQQGFSIEKGQNSDNTGSGPNPPEISNLNTGDATPADNSFFVENLDHANCQDPNYVSSLNNQGHELFFPEQCMKLLCHFGWKNFNADPNVGENLSSTRGQWIHMESENGIRWGESNPASSSNALLLIYQGWHQQFIYENFGEENLNPPLVLATSELLRSQRLTPEETSIDVFNSHHEGRFTDDEFLFTVFFTRDSEGNLREDGIQMRGDNHITRGCIKMAHTPSD